MPEAPTYVTFGKFQIGEPLGQGGYGQTYQAFMDGYPGALVIKILNKRAAAAREADQRFAREIELLRRIKSAHVAAIVEHGTIDGVRYIALEYCGGGTLRQMVSHHPAGRPLSDAVTVLVDACAGVEAAHAAGILHRDLNAGNVLLTDSGRWKVCDFGMARGIDQVSSITGDFVLPGVPYYTAPERYIHPSNQLDETYDVYSLGCLLYLVVTGRPPFFDPRGNNEAVAIIQRQTLGPVPQLPAGHRAAALNPVLSRALAKDPRHRHTSVAALAADLRRVAGLTSSGLQDSTPPSQAPSQTPPSRRPPSAGVHGALAAFDAVVHAHPTVAGHRDVARVRAGLHEDAPRSAYLGSMTIVDDLVARRDVRAASEVLLWVFRAFPDDRETVNRLRELGFSLLDPPARATWPPRFDWNPHRGGLRHP